MDETDDQKRSAFFDLLLRDDAASVKIEFSETGGVLMTGYDARGQIVGGFISDVGGQAHRLVLAGLLAAEPEKMKRVQDKMQALMAPKKT
jgi:hypothetical protein